MLVRSTIDPGPTSLTATHAYIANDTLALPASGRREAIVATDGELLMRFIQDQDHLAFAQIVERHGGLVWIICREVLGHHQDVEDAFQATFIILANARKKFGAAIPPPRGFTRSPNERRSPRVADDRAGAKKSWPLTQRKTRICSP